MKNLLLSVLALVALCVTGCKSPYRHHQVATITVTKTVDGKIVSVEKTEYDKSQDGFGRMAGARVVYDNRPTQQWNGYQPRPYNGQWSGGYYNVDGGHFGSFGGGNPSNYYNTGGGGVSYPSQPSAPYQKPTNYYGH